MLLYELNIAVSWANIVVAHVEPAPTYSLTVGSPFHNGAALVK
jgi:hypothetical protein